MQISRNEHYANKHKIADFCLECSAHSMFRCVSCIDLKLFRILDWLLFITRKFVLYSILNFRSLRIHVPKLILKISWKKLIKLQLLSVTVICHPAKQHVYEHCRMNYFCHLFFCSLSQSELFYRKDCWQAAKKSNAFYKYI